MASDYGIEVLGVTHNSVELYLYGEAPTQNEITINIHNNTTGKVETKDIEVEPGTPISIDVTIEGLSAETTYRAWCIYNDYSAAYYSEDFTTEAENKKSWEIDSNSIKLIISNINTTNVKKIDGKYSIHISNNNTFEKTCSKKLEYIENDSMFIITFSELIPNTRYFMTFDIKKYLNNGTVESFDLISPTRQITKAAERTFSYTTSATSAEITVDLDSNYSKNDRILIYRIVEIRSKDDTSVPNAVWIQEPLELDGQIPEYSFTINNLTTGATYLLDIRIEVPGYETVYFNPVEFCPDKENEDEDTEVIYLVVSNLTSEFVKVSLSGKIFKDYVKCQLGIRNSNGEIVVKADLVSITPDNIEKKFIQCNTLVGGERYTAYLHRSTPTGVETLAETIFVAPSISVENIPENSAKVYFYGTKSPEYGGLDIYLNDGESADTYQATIRSLPHEYLFENLDKNKEYTVKLTPNGFDNVLIAQATFRVGEIPKKFDWTIKKTSGEYIRVSAAEWNAFLDHVNTVRVYCGLDKASFNNVTAHTLTGRNVVTKAEVNAGVVSKNSLICYDNIRDVVDAILGKDDKYMGIGVSSEYESLINIQKGDRISADFFNNLRDAVNNVLDK